MTRHERDLRAGVKAALDLCKECIREMRFEMKKERKLRLMKQARDAYDRAKWYQERLADYEH